MRSEHVIRWVGLLATATAALEVLTADSVATPARIALASAALASFAAALVWITGPGLAGDRPRTRALLLVWQTLLGTFLDTDLIYIVALVLPFTYRRRTAATWLAVANLAGLPFFVHIVRAQLAGASPWGIAMGILPHVVWQLFGFMIGVVAMTERERRNELADANAQLVTAQRRLAEQARLDERLEISRELHDSLGHHLAALNVQLELARHLSTGEAHQAVRRAQGTGRRLLAELRGVVSAWRADSHDLPAALDQLARAIDTPAIIISVEPGLTVAPALAGALFRCAQELVTNAVRHADARHVWLGLSARDDGVCLSARDDGRGQDAIEPGNGLRGLRERAETLRGHVQLSSEPGHGFAVEIWVPTTEAAA